MLKRPSAISLAVFKREYCRYPALPRIFFRSRKTTTRAPGGKAGRQSTKATSARTVSRATTAIITSGIGGMAEGSHGEESSDMAGVMQDLNVESRRGRGAGVGQRGRGLGRGVGRRGGGVEAGRGSERKGEVSRVVAISKALSKLLRHAAVDVGLALDAEGFARVDQVMQWQRLKALQVTFADIREVVRDNSKQRFSLKLNPALSPAPDPSSEDPKDWVIRAKQGHSIPVDAASLFVPITLEADNVPDVVVHGTFFAFYQAILASGGLKRMGRNHIHFSTGLPDDEKQVISGMRSEAQILIYVDVRKSLEAGDVSWWMSENGVVLTEGDESGVLGTKYWKKVEGRKQKVGVLWEDGKEVGQLPQHLTNMKTPHGKIQRDKQHRQKAPGNGGASGGKEKEPGIVASDDLDAAGS